MHENHNRRQAMEKLGMGGGGGGGGAPVWHDCEVRTWTLNEDHWANSKTDDYLFQWTLHVEEFVDKNLV